jgi:hypothetical protein
MVFNFPEGVRPQHLQALHSLVQAHFAGYLINTYLEMAVVCMAKKVGPSSKQERAMQQQLLAVGWPGCSS